MPPVGHPVVDEEVVDDPLRGDGDVLGIVDGAEPDALADGPLPPGAAVGGARAVCPDVPGAAGAAEERRVPLRGARQPRAPRRRWCPGHEPGELPRRLLGGRRALVGDHGVLALAAPQLLARVLRDAPLDARRQSTAKEAVEGRKSGQVQVLGTVWPHW